VRRRLSSEKTHYTTGGQPPCVVAIGVDEYRHCCVRGGEIQYPVFAISSILRNQHQLQYSGDGLPSESPSKG